MEKSQPWNALSDYDIIASIVNSRFVVKDYYIRDNAIEFRVDSPTDLKKSFADVAKQLKLRGFVAFLRKLNSDIILLVGKVTYVAHFSKRKPLLLFLIVIGTVTVDGWLRVTSFMEISELIFDPLLFTLIYALAVIGIVGTHELGHTIASYMHGVKSSLPYFIPGLPGYLPTFGAVITSGEPPLNRDALFDLGLSGPIAGLIVTLIIAIPGALTSVPSTSIPINEAQILPLNTGLMMMAIFTITGRIQEGIILSPLGFAAWLGFIITFLNILPAWQLDGGHIARAVLGRKKHGIATTISIIVLILLGFWLMALLLLILSMRRIEMRPLDDVTPISKGRKYIFILVIFLAILLAPMPSLP
ncbi:MAG: site-2 protease family protein [archaeon]|nr:site-2 protease family protein [archaeon]MCP8322212.1 site-2 protease family protein [archaeon]